MTKTAQVLITSDQLLRCKRCVVVLKEVKDIADQIAVRNQESRARMLEVNGDLRELVQLLARLENVLEAKAS
jgi:hypothetical protein